MLLGPATRFVVGIASLVVFGGLGAASSFAAPTADQLAKFKTAESSLGKAESLYKAGKTTDAAAAFEQANAALGEVASVKEMARPVDAMRKRLVNVHDNLEVDGATVSAVAAAMAAPAMTKPEKPTTPIGRPIKPIAGNPKTPIGKGPALAAGEVSFTKQVAPMLVDKCGKCHVAAAKGQFSMANFASLKRGAKAVPVVLPGKGKGSRIVEVIDSGDMPRGGGSVSPDELAMLSRWIDQGAKFDGKDETDPLAGAAGATPAKVEPTPMLDVVAATGKEEVLFSRDIAPVLAENCMGCHGTQNNPPGRLRLVTFKELLIGGDSGLCVQPGKGAESLIVKKLKGTAGDRMPRGKPPLSDAVIAKFEKWIALGAKFDGLDANQTMDLVAGAYIAQVSTHEQLAAARADRARKMWRIALPDVKPIEKDTKNFFILANLSDANLDQFTTVAEQAATAIARNYKVPEDKPLVKGKMTLFVVRQRFDYSEFTRMVEERQVSQGSRAHFRYNIINAYSAIVPSASGDYSLLGMIGQQAGGLYMASLGRSPRWFSEGAGTAIGLQLDGKDARLKSIQDSIPSVLASGAKAEGFMTNSLPTDENDALSYGFVKTMMGSSSKFQQLLRSLRQGQDFDSAFGQIYRTTPMTAVSQWAAKK